MAGSRDLRHKAYIGDGVYAGMDAHDPQQMWLWTSDGIEEMNFLALGWNEIRVLIQYAAKQGMIATRSTASEVIDDGTSGSDRPPDPGPSPDAQPR